MPLETVNLDDRDFQWFVNQAKLMIPRHCPEWTDHNVSDPGVALIELFAWMADQLLYRVNLVPDKMYVKFLDLIGLQLKPPQPAVVPVTFYLSAPQPNEVTIRSGTEVATVRTETDLATIFTTEMNLAIRPPRVAGVYTRAVKNGKAGDLVEHDTRTLDLPGRSIKVFSDKPQVGDSFWVALEDDHSDHVMALVLRCEYAGGRGLALENPPWVWEVFQPGVTRWARCELEYDGTGGFNRDGEIILRLPKMSPGTIDNRTAYWLRCRLDERQSTNLDNREASRYDASPEIEGFRIESRGATARARHAITVENESLGESDGTPGQRFKLLHDSLLSRDPQTDCLEIHEPGKDPERWTEVSDFADSEKDHKHFTLENDGTLTLGPSLQQPDGTMHRFGAVPLKGAKLRFTRYQYGGGVVGNLPRGAISVLKTSIPYVARITNHQAAVGGKDMQTLEDAKLRAPQTLRTRTRAVTADDYVYLACELEGVARAHCHAPGRQPGVTGEHSLRPGEVLLSIVPTIEVPEGHVPPGLLSLNAETLIALTNRLNERRLVGTTLRVDKPAYSWINVKATLRVQERSDLDLVREVQERAEAELYRFLNPYRGGPRSDGWPFGRALHTAELLSLLQRVPGVEFVDEIEVRQTYPDSKDSKPADLVPNRLPIQPFGLICSDHHHVTVT